MEKRIVAFIDMGTNSMRLLIVRIEPNGSYRVLTQQKEAIRLGEGEFNEEYLQPAAIQRAIVVGSTFADLARSYAADEIVAVATSATREAKNQEEFVARLNQAAQISVRVISGREEARLIYHGVASGVDLGEQLALFIDIGGGSTELIVGNQREYLYLDSLKLGAIRQTLMFFADAPGPIAPAHYEAAQNYVGNLAVRTFQRIRGYHAGLAMGSSGTIENLADIAVRMFERRRRVRGDVLRREQLRAVVEQLCAMSLEERRHVAGINPERADIIIAGAAILETLMQRLDIRTLQISERGVRDGLVVDYLYRNGYAREQEGMSVRKRSVLQLGRACGFDEGHAHTVERLALELFDSARTAGLHTLGWPARELLHYAALLHDIGAFLSYNNHQAHTHYLIRHADLLGFDQRENELLALTAFYHRKSLPSRKEPDFAAIDEAGQEIVRVSSMFLRLAESLDRGHQGSVQHARLSVQESGMAGLELVCGEECQLELWGVQTHEKAFAKTFGRELVLLTRKEPASE